MTSSSHRTSTFTSVLSVPSETDRHTCMLEGAHGRVVDKLPRPKSQGASKLWTSFKNKTRFQSGSCEQQNFVQSSISFSGLLRTASQKFSIRPRWPRRRSKSRQNPSTSVSQLATDDASVVWHSDSEDDLFASNASSGDETMIVLNSATCLETEFPEPEASEDPRDSRVVSPEEPSASTGIVSPQLETSTQGSTAGSNIMERLEALDGGDIFANRYRIAHERIPGNPNCRYATELLTSKRVFLKFYTETSDQWKNAVRVHQFTQRSNFVCPLLHAIEDEKGFPPCLVFERGSFTLTSRLASKQTTLAEQRTILYSILEALEYLHSQNLTHANLTPSKIMWFESDFSWKLVGLDHASFFGESTTLPRSTSRYAAPEILRAVEKGIMNIQLQSAADMWSFGVLTFEILTCSCVCNALGVQETVRKHVEEQLSFDRDEMTRRRRAVRRRERRTAVDREEGLRFIYTLLRTDITERQTVKGALEDVFFRSAIDNCQAIGSRASIFSESELKLGDICKWPDWTWVQIFNDHTSLTLQIEYFSNKSSTDFPFNLREAEATERFYDDFLPGHPIHVLRVDQESRIHIRIAPNDDSPFSIEGIVAIRIAPPDSDFVKLETVQRRQHDAFDFMALLQPSKFKSKKMQATSPIFGIANRKYLKLIVQLRVLLGAPFRREVDLYYHIYCKMIHRRTRLRLRKRGEWLGNKRRVIKDSTLQLLADCH